MLKDVIFEKRKQKNMTQEQLAEQLGVARQTVSKWELGETLPDVENLKKMAILFSFSIDEVLGLVVEKADESDVSESGVNKNDDDDSYADASDVDEKDDSDEWLMLGGFIIGTALGIYLDNTILAFACTMLGYGLSVIIKGIKKK